MSGATFAGAAVRLAGQAGVMFGWTPEVFWGATPAELGALVSALTGGRDDAAPPDAGLVARLMREFPDG